MRPFFVLISCMLMVLTATSCGVSGEPPGVATDPAPTIRTDPAPSGTETDVPPVPVESSEARDVEGTVVRCSGTETFVDVTLGVETPTTVDFLSLLPFTMRVEEFNNREKIGDPPRELVVTGTPGSDPVDGDLIYYTPWGNLGFYYDASEAGFSESTLHLGTYEASPEQLQLLEDDDVRVAVVDMTSPGTAAG